MKFEKFFLFTAILVIGFLLCYLIQQEASTQIPVGTVATIRGTGIRCVVVPNPHAFFDRVAVNYVDANGVMRSVYLSPEQLELESE